MLVLGPQPLHEIAHLDVAPHPGREARERPLLSRERGVMAHIGVDAGGVRPIGFDRDDGEAVPFDQPAMRSLTAISEASEAVASNVENATAFRAVPRSWLDRAAI